MAAVNARLRLRLAVAGAVGWMTVMTGVVAFQVGESTGAARRAEAVAEDLRQATCPFNRELAGAPLPANTGELGRRLVRDAAAAYQRVCVPTFGPLPPVDPDAYRSAPPPTPTPSPTR